MRFRNILAIGAIITAGSVGAADAGTLRYTNFDIGDFQPIVSGKWQQSPYKETAKLAPATDPSSPLIVFAPGWSGASKYKSAFKTIQKNLGNGFSYLFLDPSTKVDAATRTLNIFSAVSASQNQGLQPKEVIIVGASGGAAEAMHASHSSISSQFPNIKISKVVAFYPTCRLQFVGKSSDKVKKLLFVGELDQVAPATLCTDMKSKGRLRSAQIISYSAAGHSWLFKHAAKQRSETSYGNCTIEVDGRGRWSYADTNSANGIEPVLNRFLSECKTKTQSLTGRINQVYKDSLGKAIGFIR